MTKPLEVEAESLKPCPHCGGEPEPAPQNGYIASRESETGFRVFIWCPECDAQGGQHNTPEEAIEAWNRRSPIPSVEAEEVEAVARIIEPDLWRWADESKRPYRSERIQLSLTKARAILSRSTAVREGEEPCSSSASLPCQLDTQALSPAGGWRPIDTAPQDGTLILACQRPEEGQLWFKTWEQWKAPQTIAWRAFHPNAPGKEQWRDAKGSPVTPDLWMPLGGLSVQP